MSKSSGGAKARLLRSGLRLQREALGLSVREAARLVTEELKKDPTSRRDSVSSSTLSAWENDVSQPTQDGLAAWCRALELIYDPVIYSAKDERIPILVRARTIRLARTADLLPDEDVRALISMAETLLSARS